MTSPSRRKPLITAPSTKLAKETNPSAANADPRSPQAIRETVRRSELWQQTLQQIAQQTKRAASVVALVGGLFAAGVALAGETEGALRWRPVRQVAHFEEEPTPARREPSQPTPVVAKATPNAATSRRPERLRAEAIEPTIRLAQQTEPVNDPFGQPNPNTKAPDAPTGALEPLPRPPRTSEPQLPGGLDDGIGDPRTPLPPRRSPGSDAPARPSTPSRTTEPSVLQPTQRPAFRAGPSDADDMMETPTTPRPMPPLHNGGAMTEDDSNPCIQAKEDCRKELQKLKDYKLDRISLDISVAASLLELKVNKTPEAGKDFPCECTLGNDMYMPRAWGCTVFQWKASALCHKPLYFEDVQLERYGHSWGPVLDPFVSAAHFFGTLPVLPYKMGMETPNECVYALGYYRPGNCAPYVIDAIPLSPRGALFEGAAIGGLILALP